MDYFRNLFSDKLVVPSKCKSIPPDELVVIVEMDHLSRCFRRAEFLQSLKATRKDPIGEHTYTTTSLDLIENYPEYAIFQEIPTTKDNIFLLRPLKVKMQDYLQGLVSKKVVEQTGARVQKHILGKGKFGVVTQQGDNPVVSKAVEIGPDAYREVITMKTLQNSQCCIVKVFSVENNTEKIFIQMPKYEEMLHTAIFDRSLRGKELSILLQLTKGLFYSHQQGYLHGDFKPGNCFLSGEEVVVGDWGKAFPYLYLQKYKEYLLQTAIYRAPELFLGEPFTSAVDVFALGIVGAELFLDPNLLTVIEPKYDQPLQLKAMMSKWTSNYPDQLITILNFYGINTHEEFLKKRYTLLIPVRFFYRLPYRLYKLCTQMCCNLPAARPTYAEILGSKVFEGLATEKFAEVSRLEVLLRMPVYLTEVDLGKEFFKYKYILFNWFGEIMKRTIGTDLLILHLSMNLTHYVLAQLPKYRQRQQIQLAGTCCLYLIASSAEGGISISDLSYLSTIEVPRLRQCVEEILQITNYQIFGVCPLMFLRIDQTLAQRENLFEDLFWYHISPAQVHHPLRVAEYFSFKYQVPLVTGEIVQECREKSVEEILDIVKSFSWSYKLSGFKYVTLPTAEEARDHSLDIQFEKAFLSTTLKRYRNFGILKDPLLATVKEIREYCHAEELTPERGRRVSASLEALDLKLHEVEDILEYLHEQLVSKEFSSNPE